MEEHLLWLNRELADQSSSEEVCQCGTAMAIRKSTNPYRLTAVLFSYAFLDQFVYAHAADSHAAFKAKFPGPKLAAHGSGGNASPSWLLGARGNGIADMSTADVIDIFSDVVSGGLAWIYREKGVDLSKISAVLYKEMRMQIPDMLDAAVCSSIVERAERSNNSLPGRRP